jgi:putative transposase
MKKSQFTEEQPFPSSRRKTGEKVAEACRKHGISKATYYQSKAMYAGLEVSQLRHLMDFESELTRVERIYAGMALGLLRALVKWIIAIDTRADRALDSFKVDTGLAVHKCQDVAQLFLQHRYRLILLIGAYTGEICGQQA